MAKSYKTLANNHEKDARRQMREMLKYEREGNVAEAIWWADHAAESFDSGASMAIMGDDNAKAMSLGGWAKACRELSIGYQNAKIATQPR